MRRRESTRAYNIRISKEKNRRSHPAGKGDKHEPTLLFTFRVTTVTAEIAPRSMFELSAAFGARADQARHTRVRRSGCLDRTLFAASF